MKKTCRGPQQANQPGGAPQAAPISRRSFLGTGAGALAALSGSGLLTACGRPLPPNIIFILADDLGFGELGCYGQTKIRTPHLDRIAAEGMRFTQHYSGSPVCAPSRCSLLTGLHTGHSYIRDNDEMAERGDVWRDPALEGQRPLLPGTVTIGTLLQQAGYATAMIGKWGLGGPGSSGHPNRQGFDHFYGYLCQRVAHNYYPASLWRNDTRVPLEGNAGLFPHQGLPPGADPDDPASYQRYGGAHYAPDLMLDEALAWIRRSRAHPFALILTPPLPHLSLQVPEAALQRYAGQFPEQPYSGEQGYLPQRQPRAAYAAMVSSLDDYVGRILALLQELGLDERTLLLFSSDNGPTFAVGGADTAWFHSNGGLRGGKTDLYEGGIRVPLLARWPGHVPAGTVNDLPCASWDFLPTLAELGQAAFSGPTDGHSLLPTLLGRRGQHRHDYLYWEYHSRPGQAVRRGRWKALRLDIGRPNAGPLQLYDLETDPAESRDLAAQQPEIAAEMTAIMKRRTRSVIAKWNF